MNRHLCFLTAIIGILAACFLNEVQAAAQRTSQGQFFISSDYMKNISPSQSVSVMGGEVFVGQYLGRMYWQAGLEFSPEIKNVPVGSVVLSAGALYRLWATRTRSFNGYIGGHALFGAEYSGTLNDVVTSVVKGDDGDDTPSSDETQLDGEGSVKKARAFMTYGLEPRFEMELFLFRNVAFTGGLSLPVRIKTESDVLSVRFHVGLRVNF